MPHGGTHYGNGNGNGMRTMRGRRTPTRRAGTATPRRGRAATPRRGRTLPRRGRAVTSRRTTPRRTMMNGTGARGLRARTGPTGRGRGGVRRVATRRPAPVMRRGRTQPMTMNRTQARGRMTSGQGNHGFRGVDGLGHNT
tara:strand:- start:147 stop:566 length:420 start_codon:yes stop_codon:yes gene_type:complete